MIADADNATLDLQTMASADLLTLLNEDLRRPTLDFIDWLLRVTPLMAEPPDIIDGICNRLLGLGVPVDRYQTKTAAVTADMDAFGATWIRGEGVVVSPYVTPVGDDMSVPKSPFAEAAATLRWVEFLPLETPDDRFGIVPAFKAAGYTHYLCAPLPMPFGIQGWFTAATKAPAGFTRVHLAVMALVIPPLASLIGTRIARLTLDRLLQTYVGQEPHRAILDGNAKRGQVTTIRSAILFMDMRDSVGHTADIGVLDAVRLMNDFFECLVPPIEACGGEVLKYMGDGLLAIFRQVGEDGSDGAARALAAAEQGFDNIVAFNRKRGSGRPVDVGMALHHGEAAYGNVGSGSRLDFTVIGRDVAMASRIGGLNARIGEPLLLSSAFVDALGGACDPVGSFTLRGFADPIAVYRPRGRSERQ